MTAPVAPPATSVAQTAAQVKALLDADLATAETVKGIYIYVDASVIQSPGYAVHDLGTLIKRAPSSTVAKDESGLVDVLATNAGTVYMFYENAVAVATGVDVGDLIDELATAQANHDFPVYGTDVPTLTVRITAQKATKFTTKDVIPAPEVFFTQGDEYVVSAQVQVGAQGIYYLIVFGSDENKFIRQSDTELVLH